MQCRHTNLRFVNICDYNKCYFTPYLQGSQTGDTVSLDEAVFYTFTYLQGSQTITVTCMTKLKFYTFTYLQGSQTSQIEERAEESFYTFTYLQGSQTQVCIVELRLSFTPLLTYKVLKPQIQF